MSTDQKKYQIFISSTFADLQTERQIAIRVVLDMHHIPSGMEAFPAADMKQFDYIKKVIDQCDYYILIIGARYGSVDTEGISYTEREYDYAIEKNKTVLALVHGDPDTIPVAKTDKDIEKAAKLQAFREKVSSRLVKFWRNENELETGIIMALFHAFNNNPAEGWIRGGAAASEELLQQINDLRLTNERLNKIIAERDNYPKIDMTGIAGIDDKITLPASLYNNSPYGRSDIINAKPETTAREIFSYVGNYFMRAADPTLISAGLKEFFKSKYNRSAVDIADNIVLKVKFHLISLGLLNSFNAEAKGGGIREWLQITDQGRSVLMHHLAFKKPE